MNKADIPFLSVAELGGLFKKKEVSPVEAIEAYLDRIDRVDGKLNSYITVCREVALREAKEAERALSHGEYLGPMHGIPVAVKDQMNTKGIRTTAGSTSLWEFVPDEDATVVANLKKAGAILLGKLNMSEMALGESFYHPAGTPRNPWNLELNPGISSSGSGAATAAFLCATSLGEDTGGSIRIPAAWCGIVGLRPTWGRVSRYGVLPLSWSMDTVGPISRTVEDCAITLDAIAGYDPLDSYTWNTPVPGYRRALSGDIKDVKVGLLRQKVYSDSVDPEIRDSVVAAAGVLGELGASVEEVSIPITDSAGAISKAITDVEGALFHFNRLRTNAKVYEHNSRVRLLTAALMPAQAIYKAEKLRTLLRDQVLEALKQFDVLISPTSPTEAPKIAESPGVSGKEEAQSSIWGQRNFTGPFNLASIPALALPCGFTSGGLPISLSVAARPFEEETLLRVAHAYERNTSWHTRRPPV